MAGANPVNAASIAGNVSQEEAQFVNNVAAQTGVDPRVVQAWVNAEGAYAPNGTGGLNFLNLRPATGDVGVSSVSSGNFDQFSNLQSAITSTVNRIKQPFLWSYLGPFTQGQGTPSQQINAIASSGWDAGHYGGSGGVKLLNIFSGLYGAGALGAQGKTASNTAVAEGGSSGGGVNSALRHIPGVAQVENAGSDVSAVTGFLGSLTNPNTIYRAGEIVGGAVLAFTGLFLLAKQVGLPVPNPVAAVPVVGPTVVSASNSTDQNYQKGVQQSQAAAARKAGRQSQAASTSDPLTPTMHRQRQRADRIRQGAATIPDGDIPF